jgi:hypothetical protein
MCCDEKKAAFVFFVSCGSGVLVSLPLAASDTILLSRTRCDPLDWIPFSIGLKEWFDVKIQSLLVLLFI